MTVTSTVNKNQYTANGSLTTFAYGFLIFSDSDLEVYVDDVLQTLSTHYTVTNAGVASGGNVVFGTAPANGLNVTILRSVPYTQTVDYTAYDPFPAETHESALDRNTMLSQQLLEQQDRSLRMKPSFTGGQVLVETPSAGKALKWNAAGTAIINSTDSVDGITSDAAASAAAAAASATAAAASESAAGISETNSATSASTSSTNAASTAADAVNTAADAVSTAADVVSTNADVVSSAASASTATSQASAASTSATNAATSEANALTYKNQAETAKTAAEAAQAAAEAAADNFDDVYLGAKASDPTVDNDGDALTAGDMYYNTATSRMRVYDGSSWSDVALDAATVVAKTSATGSGQLPAGTTAQRDGSPSAGVIRFNSTDGSFEGYDGSAWGAIGGGASGGNGEATVFENEITISEDYTITSTYNGVSAGPLTVTGTITVPSGSTWVIV